MVKINGRDWVNPADLADPAYRRWYSWLWFRFTARIKFFPVVSNKGFLKRTKRRTWRYNRRPSG